MLLYSLAVPVGFQRRGNMRRVSEYFEMKAYARFRASSYYGHGCLCIMSHLFAFECTKHLIFVLLILAAHTVCIRAIPGRMYDHYAYAYKYYVLVCFPRCEIASVLVYLHNNRPMDTAQAQACFMRYALCIDVSRVIYTPSLGVPW